MKCMARIVREVIADAIHRDDYKILAELRIYLTVEQENLKLILLEQKVGIMRDVCLVNTFKPPDFTMARRKTLLALSSLVGKFTILTEAFITPIIPDNELMLELLDSTQINDHQKRSLLDITHQAFRQDQTHAARVLTAWLMEHTLISDLDMYEIFDSSIDESGGDEWVFKKMYETEYLQSVLRKAIKGEVVIAPQLLCQLHKLPSDVKYVAIKGALRKRRTKA